MCGQTSNLQYLKKLLLYIHCNIFVFVFNVVTQKNLPDVQPSDKQTPIESIDQLFFWNIDLTIVAFAVNVFPFNMINLTYETNLKSLCAGVGVSVCVHVLVCLKTCVIHCQALES